MYEQILRIPYYFVFNRYNNEFRAFQLRGSHYESLSIQEQGVWLEQAELGLGLWEGQYQGINRLWLRWYDQNGNWILTPAEQEAQRAEQATQRAERLAQQLRALGVDPEA